MTVIQQFSTKQDGSVFARSIQFGNFLTGKFFHVNIVDPSLCKDGAAEECRSKRLGSIDEVKVFVASIHKEPIAPEDLVMTKMG